ncbi:MAG: hypothetical protein EOO38_15060, partial [Cytophagaceae bacterium]
VKDINPGSAGSTADNLVNFNGTLYFTASDGVNGVELWRSNGTAAGTVMVKDIFNGSSSSSPANLIVVNGRLVFTANDGINGVEIWVSDGTTAGTYLLQNIAPHGSSTPLNFHQGGINLFASVITDDYNRELWMAGTAFVLPVRQLEIAANVQHNDGLVKWSTLQEADVHTYGVERSLNGRDFEPVGAVVSAGNGNHQYSFVDRDVRALKVRVVFYRLKINNQDGSHCRKRCLGVSLAVSFAVILLSSPPPHALSPSLCLTLLSCPLLSVALALPLFNVPPAAKDLVVTMHMSTGEALPLHARAHPPCSPRILHPQVAGYKRKL